MTLTHPKRTTTHARIPVSDQLFWINHDVTDMKALPSRGKIQAHVQRNHKTLKRREETRAQRTSALRRTLQNDILLRKIVHEKWQRGPFSKGTANVRREYPPRRHEPDANSSSMDLIVRPVSPVSMVGKGNSDPFHVYSIAIGPAENQLLSLYRDIVLPSLYHLHVDKKGLNDSNLNDLAERDWLDNVAGLEERGTALGTLARFGAMAARSNMGMLLVGLKYLGQSTRVLRDKVSRRQELDNRADCLHINMLFDTENINGNHAGALAHGKMLLHIFKQQWKQQRLDYKLLLYQLHNDLQFTATFLTRPIFDEGDWLLIVLKPIWDAAAQHIPSYLEDRAEDGLDPAIEDETVVHHFTKRRQIIHWEGLHTSKDNCLPPVEIATTSFLASTFLFHSRMMTYYADAEEQLQRELLTDQDKAHLYAHQVVALASAQLQRWTVVCPQLMGIPIYDDSRAVNALKYSLQQCQAYSAKSGSDKYRNAMLWAMYVGVLVEGGPSYEPRVKNSDTWFHDRLAELARQMQIFKWKDLKFILRGFLYEESLMAKGSIWFEELVIHHQLNEDLQQHLNSLDHYADIVLPKTTDSTFAGQAEQAEQAE